MTAQTALLQGTLDLLILKTLSAGELHGLGISRRIGQVTHGAFEVKPGSLFPALHRMEERRLIRAEWGVTENHRRARYYKLTSEGRSQLRSQAASLVRYARTVVAILADHPT
mgnify:CR=1 FL=1